MTPIHVSTVCVCVYVCAGLGVCLTWQPYVYFSALRPDSFAPQKGLKRQNNGRAEPLKDDVLLDPFRLGCWKLKSIKRLKMSVFTYVSGRVWAVGELMMTHMYVATIFFFFFVFGINQNELSSRVCVLKFKAEEH